LNEQIKFKIQVNLNVLDRRLHATKGIKIKKKRASSKRRVFHV